MALTGLSRPATEARFRQFERAFFPTELSLSSRQLKTPEIGTASSFASPEDVIRSSRAAEYQCII